MATFDFDGIALSARTRNALIRAGLRTVAEVVAMRPSELLKYGGFGRMALSEVSAALLSSGIEWGRTRQCPCCHGSGVVQY